MKAQLMLHQTLTHAKGFPEYSHTNTSHDPILPGVKDVYKYNEISHTQGSPAGGYNGYFLFFLAGADPVPAIAQLV